MLSDQKRGKIPINTGNSSEDDLVSRLEALLSKPSSTPITIPSENQGGKGKENVSIYTNKYRDPKGEFINSKQRESADLDYQNSNYSVPLSAKSSILVNNNPNQRIPINTSCFGRKSIIDNPVLSSTDSPIDYTLQSTVNKPSFDDFAKLEIYDSKIDNSPFLMKQTKSKVESKQTIISLDTNPSSINPTDIFNKDEVSGEMIKKGKKDLVNQWVDEIDESDSKLSPKPTFLRLKRRSGRNKRLLSRSKPTFLKKMNRKKQANEDSTEINSVYSTASSFNLIEAKVSHRDKQWHVNYLAKRKLINKVEIPPRNSSLNSTKQLLEKYKDSKVLSNHYKQNLSPRSEAYKPENESGVKFVDTVFEKSEKDVASPTSKRDPFDIKVAYGVNSKFEVPSSPSTLNTVKVINEPSKLASLPHFRTLLRRRRTHRVKRRSIKVVPYRPQFQ